MAEIGPNISPTIVINNGGDARGEAARAERREAGREAVRAEARENFEQADRMVAEYINRTSRTSPPKAHEDFAQIRQFVRSFYNQQALNDKEVDHLMRERFPNVAPDLMGVTNPETAAPSQPSPSGDARPDADSRGAEPRDARGDTGEDAYRFVKNPNPANARPLVARGVPADAPPPPQPGVPLPQVPLPNSPLAKPGTAVVVSDAAPDQPAPSVPGAPAVPSTPMPSGEGAEPPPPVRMFSLGHSFGPGRDQPPDILEHGLKMQHQWSAFQTRGGNMAGTPLPAPIPTAVTGGETLLGRLARSRTTPGASGRKGDDRSEGLDGALSRGVYRQLGFRRA